MIVVTRRNGEKVFINPSNFESMEQHEDVLITLTSGKKIVVVESAENISAQLLKWWQEIFKVNNR